MATRLFHGTPEVGFVGWSAALKSVADQYGERVAVRDGGGHTLTYKDLSSQAHRLAHHLIAQKGITPGQPVATLLPNSLSAVWASYGVRMTGAAEVPLGATSTLDELLWCARLADFECVLTTRRHESDLRQAGFDVVCVDTLTPAHEQCSLAAVDGALPGRILFTSGTTGPPKGVVYSHAARWMGEQLLKATLPFVPGPGDQIILMTPFVHGTSLLTYAWCDHGAEVILLDGVDEAALENLLPDPRLRAIFAPPTVLAKITGRFQGQTFHQVQCVFTGTQPLTPAIYQRAQAMFGPVVRITYGKSECVNPITILKPEQTQAYYNADDLAPGACVGYPAPGVEIKIQAQEVQQGQDDEATDGEIWLRARQMSAGMLTQAGFAPHEPDGWHQTGDLGHLDAQGRLVLTGRVADVIKTGGYRVNPDEIEALLTGWSDSMQISVTSLPSDYWGEVIIAVAENPQTDWIDQVNSRVQGVSRHKRPRLHASLAALPRNAQGKVNRRQVKGQVLAHYRLVDGPYPSLEPLSKPD